MSGASAARAAAAAIAATGVVLATATCAVAAVDLFTGLYVREGHDIVLGGAPPIRLVRTYRNRDPHPRAFGIGTSHPYDLHLVGDAARFQHADLILADGGRVHYVRTSRGTDHASADFVHVGTPTAFHGSRLRWNGHGWEIVLQDGSRYAFLACSPGGSSRCALIDYRDPEGRRLHLTRNAAGDLTRISSGWLRSVRLHHDATHRITRAEAGWGWSMTTVDYEYDAPGRLVRVVARHLSPATVLLELARAYGERRLPRPGSFWAWQTSEYTYDDDHNLRVIREPGIELTNHYDTAGRVVRQDVAGWGHWTFAYTEDATGRVVQTDVVDPDGRHRRVLFNAAGYHVRDTIDPGLPAEHVTEYDRDAQSQVIRRVTVRCRTAAGAPTATTAAVAPAETAQAVRTRLLAGCASR